MISSPRWRSRLDTQPCTMRPRLAGEGHSSLESLSVPRRSMSAPCSCPVISDLPDPLDTWQAQERKAMTDFSEIFRRLRLRSTALSCFTHLMERPQGCLEIRKKSGVSFSEENHTHAPVWCPCRAGSSRLAMLMVETVVHDPSADPLQTRPITAGQARQAGARR